MRSAVSPTAVASERFRTHVASALQRAKPSPDAGIRYGVYSPPSPVSRGRGVVPGTLAVVAVLALVVAHVGELRGEVGARSGGDRRAPRRRLFRLEQPERRERERFRGQRFLRAADDR